MQITNNYQPNFRAATIDAEAIKILSKRLKPEELKPFIKKFKEYHDTNEYDIVLGALSVKKSQLDACITYDKEHFRHIPEGYFSRKFMPPEYFTDKVIPKQMNQDIVSIATKKHIRISFWEKLAYFLL